MHNKWLLIFFILLSCNSRKQVTVVNTSTGTMIDSLNKADSGQVRIKPAAHNFWDSVSMGIKLSYEQIYKYTTIESEWSMDSFYIASYDSIEFNFKEGLGYWPDSSFTTPQGFKVAILRHNGPNCLVVFDSTGTRNISTMEIEEGCDRDGDDSPYSSREYRILSNSVFETIETSDPGDVDKKDWNLTITTTKLKINNRGLIDSVGRKIKKERKDPPED
jgi:hypothetical protein